MESDLCDMMLGTVNTYFGFPTLKPGQRDVIEHVLESGDDGGDVVCKFPTGYGKSLCYCVPVLHLRRWALVVSPLCSLIQDQTKKLNMRGRVAYNMSSSGGEAGTVTRDEALVFGNTNGCGLPEDDNGALCEGALLFCTPEKLACAGFRAHLQALHARHPLAYIVLDEAHLVAEQGYSFRSAYLELGWLREAFPATRLCCFSATCNNFVSSTLDRMLSLRKTRTFELADARLNLHLNVHIDAKRSRACTCSVHGCRWGGGGSRKDGGRADIVTAVASYGGGEAIVFANSRATVEELSSMLQRAVPGKTVAHYHGGLTDAERVAVQNDFVAGVIDVLVATMASFGTGVDMPRVIKVVIVGVPASVHTLVQLVGRGGRAGQPYWVDIFACDADATKQGFIVKNEINKLSKDIHPGYAEYLHDSFALVQRVLHTAKAGTVCCIQTLLTASAARSVELRVPFSHLAALKAVNKRVPAVDAARWNPKRRKWILPPLACSIPYGEWFQKNLGEVSVPISNIKCGRCSTCKSNKRKADTPIPK